MNNPFCTAEQAVSFKINPSDGMDVSFRQLVKKNIVISTNVKILRTLGTFIRPND